MNMLDYCRRYSELSAMQMNFLYRISVVLPLVADLAHAQVAVYVKVKKERKLLVAATAEPHTTFNPFKECTAGMILPCIEEPIICHTISENKKYHGHREVEFGRFIEMYTVPVVDGDAVIAAICFEINPEDTKIEGFSRLLKTAFTILKNSQKKLEPNMSAPSPRATASSSPTKTTASSSPMKWLRESTTCWASAISSAATSSTAS